jgi:type VI secretion system protein ImpA
MDPTDLLHPIAGDHPSGASIRYEPVFDQIKVARIEEDEAPQGDWKRERKTADWPLVIKLATDVLTNRSKDLQIAVWLTEALTSREGFAGLHAGLRLLHGLLENFWDTLHPQLEDGDAEFRAAPLDWLGSGYLDATIRFVPLNAAGHDYFAYRQARLLGYEEQAGGDSSKLASRQQALDDGALSPEEFDESFKVTPKPFYKQIVADIDATLDTLDTLDRLSDEKFGSAAPSFSKMRESLKEVRLAAGQLLARKLEQDPDPVSAEPDPAPAMGGQPGGTTAAGATGGGMSAVPTSAQDAANRVAAAARFMRSAAPSNPAPYLMLRGLRWGELRAADTIDPLMLEAPPTDVRTRLKTLLLKAEWSKLIEAGEDVMASAYGRGWLDLQRYVLTALAELGSEYEHVSTAIRGALRSLLRDVPDLIDQTLMDDSPTANVETRAWLRDNGLLDAGDEPDLPETPSSRGRPRSRRDPYEQAMERVRAGDTDRAVDLLMREASQEKSERARFLRRSQAASIMVDARLEAVAMPILQEMLEQIDKHDLEEWESGETVAQALGLLYRCMSGLGEDESTREALYLRVCRLDPIQAIRFNTPSSTQSDERPSE